jgi:hypothetical protein
MPPQSEHNDNYEPVRPFNASDLFDVETAMRYNKGVEILDSFEESRNETIQSIIELLNSPYDFQRQNALGLALDHLTITFAHRVKNINENADDTNDRVSSIAHLLISEEQLIKVAFSDAINSCSEHGARQHNAKTLEIAITDLYNSYKTDSPELLERLTERFIEDVSVHIAHALDVHSSTPSSDTYTKRSPIVDREITAPKEIQAEPRKLGRGILKIASLGIFAAGSAFVARRFLRKSK